MAGFEDWFRAFGIGQPARAPETRPLPGTGPVDDLVWRGGSGPLQMDLMPYRPLPGLNLPQFDMLGMNLGIQPMLRSMGGMFPGASIQAPPPDPNRLIQARIRRGLPVEGMVQVDEQPAAAVGNDPGPGPQPRRGPTSWDHLVPSGQGRIERGGTHGGYPAVDIFAPAGTPIYAPVDGVSSPATYSLGGNATTLRGADGRWYYFAHAQRPMVGGQVKKGQIIGYVGNTGNAKNTPSHLHYAVATNPNAFNRYNGSGDIDPY